MFAMMYLKTKKCHELDPLSTVDWQQDEAASAKRDQLPSQCH